MLVNMLKSKIHRATVTGKDISYEGSITVDEKLLAAAGILEHEKVQVLNINNGSRFETYAIKGTPGSGEICLNGAAARLAEKGDIVIILAYVWLEENESKNFKPQIVHIDEKNNII